MRDRHFMEDENELPFLVSSKRDDFKRNKNVTDKNVMISKNCQKEAWRLKEENKLRDAESLINEAIKLNPYDEENWNIKGLILWEIFSNIQVNVAPEAYDSFNKALLIQPNNEVIKKNRLTFLYEWASKEHRRAQWLDDYEIYEESLRITDEFLSRVEDKKSHNYSAGLNLKGCIFDSMGNYTKAFEYYNKALDITPNDNIVQENKNNLIKKYGDCMKVDGLL